jgi:hypothetical protein
MTTDPDLAIRELLQTKSKWLPQTRKDVSLMITRNLCEIIHYSKEITKY